MSLQAAERPDGGPFNVLVVDDHRGNILAVEQVLDGLDLRVVPALSGDEALKKLLHTEFALVLLDVQMPRLDGFETARLLRGVKRLAQVPIIFVTAHHQDLRSILAGYSLGAVDFLIKPVVPEVLRTKVSVLIELRGQALRLRAHERRETERKLVEARARWEAEALRAQLEEQNRIEKALVRVNLQLEEADRRKDEFLATVAHELRNPLAAMVTSLDLLDLTRTPGMALDAARAALQRQVRHLTRLVDDLLDLSRVTFGKIELQAAPLDAAQLLHQAVELVRPELEEREHELGVTCAEGVPLRVLGDEIRLTQVVANLLSNAARYTNPRGHIELSAGRTGARVWIRVRDDGIGMTPETLERIFEPFVRQSRRGSGLGLGLALVRNLVALHGGQVTATSAGEGLGSEFAVELPALPETAETAQQPAPVPPAAEPQRPLRVVLIEENDDLRESLRSLLERLGHRVETAAHGAVGFERILTSRPDVALVAVPSRGESGYELAQRVRFALSERCPRLVAMTELDWPRARARVRQAGFDAEVTKPVTAPELLRTLASATANGS